MTSCILNVTVKAIARSKGEVCFLCLHEIIYGYRVEPAQLGIQ